MRILHAGSISQVLFKSMIRRSKNGVAQACKNIFSKTDLKWNKQYVGSSELLSSLKDWGSNGYCDSYKVWCPGASKERRATATVNPLPSPHFNV